MPETTCQIRVRYAETDGMGVVYYSRAEDGALLASGTTLHVAVGRDGKPCRLPRKLTELIG